MKPAGLLAALLFLSLLTSAQNPAIKIYTANDGLPATLTRDVYQDRYGYLWISTPDGLSRFDGRQFVNYSIEDGLPSLNVTKVYQDSKERLWVGSNAGIAQFKNNRFFVYPTTDKQENLYILNFAELAGGRVLALTADGVYEFADTVWKKRSFFPGFDDRKCRDLLIFDGELYLNYQQEIVCQNRRGEWQLIAQNPFFNVMSVQQGHLLVSSPTHLYEIKAHNLTPLLDTGITRETEFSYKVDSKNRLWIVGYNLLKVSRPDDWRHFTQLEKAYNSCTFVVEDSSRNIWVGSLEGLLKIKDLSFTAITPAETPFLDGIYNIIPLPDNRMIFSSGTKYGLILHDSAGDTPIKPVPATAGYSRDPVDAYAFDSNRRLWMATRLKRLLCFDGQSFRDCTTILHLRTSEHIYDLAYAKKRSRLFVCADSTLLVQTPAGFSPFIPKNTGRPIVKPTRVRELNNGLILLYVDGKGIYSIDAANNLSSLIAETGVDGSRKGIQLPVCFYEDAGDNFWLAVPGSGLYEFGTTKNNTLFPKAHLTTADGLQSNHIKSLTGDPQNRLWVVTNAGIDLLQQNPLHRWAIFNYAGAPDLGVDVFDFSKVQPDAAGNIWFSSPKKIIRFITKDIRLEKKAPNLLIEKMILPFKDTNSQIPSDSVRTYFQLPVYPSLRYDQNSIAVSFNAIDLSGSNADPEYSYKLLPLDTSWSSPSKTRSVSLTRLPAGSYTFMVRARNKASDWSRTATVGFSIGQPFWNTWWFRLIIIAIVAAIVIAIFRARIKKISNDALIDNQLKELEMKALKAQMNPHFIYNALNSIQSLIASGKTSEGIRYIGSFSRLLRAVLDNSENNVIGLDKEIDTIDLYIQLESLRLDLQLQYTIDIDRNIVPEFERIPPLILQPFIENALWHGLSHKEGIKKIAIVITSNENWLLCGISDNGIGREKAAELKRNSLVVHESKGIELTRKRLLSFNNDDSVNPIDFSDELDAQQNPLGTKVVLTIARKSR